VMLNYDTIPVPQLWDGNQDEGAYQKVPDV
jgi:hypothetical protein